MWARIRVAELGCHLPASQIILRRDAKGVCDAVEKREQSCDVDRFRNLVFFPACVPDLLNIFSSGTISRVCDQLRIIQQSAIGGAKAGFVQFAFENCGYTLIGCSLDTQEVGMTVQSIWTAIEERDVTGEHLFLTTREMPFGEMNSVGELNYLAQEVWTRAEALDDARDLLPSGTCAPEIVGSESVARGVCVFGDFDLCGGRWG